jgi:tight adherence protein C
MNITSPQVVALFAGYFVVLAITIGFLRHLLSRSQVARRVAETPSRATVQEDMTDRRGWLYQYLFLAGFRSQHATATFVVATVAVTSMGVLIGALIWWRNAMAGALASLAAFPGGVGDIVMPVVIAAPWLAVMTLGSLPWLWVRAARRRRVEKIERDLPLVLELLAMLTESGLGFDAALERVIVSHGSDRPLIRELLTFQLESLSGRPRVECFRRLARRIEVSAVNVFVSALVQAEQIGAGIAAVLRRQADDLRDRRREDAIALAMAMPVKRLFPMMICFLPGIFVATLGPTFFQFFQYAETIIQVRDFGATP